IPANSRMIENFATVALDESVDVHAGWNFAEAHIAAAGGRIEWRLVRQNKTGARNKRHTALRQGLFQRRPRHRINSSPRIRPQKQPDRERKLIESAHSLNLTTARMNIQPIGILGCTARTASVDSRLAHSLVSAVNWWGLGPMRISEIDPTIKNARRAL